VFGAEAQQLFCESFHVAVKFKRKSRKFADFSAPAGLTTGARRALRAWRFACVVFPPVAAATLGSDERPSARRSGSRGSPAAVYRRSEEVVCSKNK
jgi:hypothetical protein